MRRRSRAAAAFASSQLLEALDRNTQAIAGMTAAMTQFVEQVNTRIDGIDTRLAAVEERATLKAVSGS